MVSVIIPTYNRANTILRSIESVLSQTYQDLELIIVDDSSTDNTEDVIRSIKDSRVKYIRQTPNQGACAARNLGIDHARGEYIAFQDSDDVWLPNKIEVQLEALINNNADVCFCKLEKHYVNDEAPPFEFPDMTGSRICTHRDMYLSSKAGTQTILSKKNVCDMIKFDMKVKKGQDYDWTIRASEIYTFYYIDQPLAIQFVQNDSISISGSKGIAEARMYFLEKYRYKFEEHPDFKLSLLKSLVLHKYMIGEEAVDELKEIYELEKNMRNYGKYLLAKCKILGIVYKLMGRRKKVI